MALDGDGPFMSVSPIDPISLSYPWVLDDGFGGFDMWYGSTITWDAGNKEMIHVIHHAASPDGHVWRRDGLAVPYEIGVAQAFSRPSAIRNQDGGLEMWFSYRSGTGQKYRLGHAHVDEVGQWRLSLESAGIDVSEQGWDSEMIEYPYVFDHAGDRYMFYNGKGFGRTGFGLAVLSDE